MGRREIVSATGDSHWFESIADHLGSAYLRYSFTKGTAQEVDAVIDWLGLVPGERVLDVGCGPGRHAHELSSRGFVVHGIDISEKFVTIANDGATGTATFERMDARHMTFASEFDAAICLCQGAFGLMTADGDDETVLQGIARALRPGGRLALSAFSSYFTVKYFSDADFDAGTGVNHEMTEVKDENGAGRQVEMWTGCYTPRELRLLAANAGLLVEHLFSVEPGAYRPDEPTVETPEFLLIASKPPSHRQGPGSPGH